MVLGIAAIVCGGAVAMIRFSEAHKQEEQALYNAAVQQRMAAGMPIAA